MRQMRGDVSMKTNGKTDIMYPSISFSIVFCVIYIYCGFQTRKKLILDCYKKICSIEYSTQIQLFFKFSMIYA